MITRTLALRRHVALCASIMFFFSALMICLSAHTLTAQTSPSPTPQNQRPSNQPTQNSDGDRARAFRLLFEESRYADALPIFQRLAAANPNDAQVQLGLGVAQFLSSENISNQTERRAARVRARAALLRARELGTNNELIERLLAAIPADGGDTSRFSENEQADSAMREGEAAFAREQFDTAFNHYTRALQLDPRLYRAALYAGNMRFQKAMRGGVTLLTERNRLLTEAGEWFARAIAIDPNIETAYRYWGSALMEQGRMDEARDKVIEAYITQPYVRLSSAGLGRWAQMNNIRQIGHPEILGLPAPLGSLREEAAALRARVAEAQREVSAGTRAQLDSSLAALARLDREGLLEAYIFLARPNQAIAREYEAYARANRDKLRRYVREYILHGGAENRSTNTGSPAS
jgi:tetratricopeptide (TPR) repeat protein